MCICVVPRSNTLGDEYAASMPCHIELVVLDVRKLKPPMEEINATGCVPRVLANARPSNVGTDRELAERKSDVHQHWRGARSQAPESLWGVCCVVAFISSIGGLKLDVVWTILKWGRHQFVNKLLGC